MPVFLFPGQGAQFSGMGMDMYDADTDGSMGIRNLFDSASSIYGKDIRTVLNSDAEVLKRTDVSQIAITVVSLAAVRFLSARNIGVSACAGFSLGEYPALAVSGILSEEDTLKLVIERGRIMQKASDALASSGDEPAGMSVVLGLSSGQIDEIIASSGTGDLYAANYNSPLQTVVSGTAPALEKAAEIFKEAGARRVLRLKVAGPFHSPLMNEAKEEFAAVLENFAFSDPSIPVFSNVTGKRITGGAEAKQCAARHLVSPVRWTLEESEIALLMQGLKNEIREDIPELIEAGPGKVLSGLWTDSGLPGVCKPYTEAGRE
ncbi:ACP S-malonyltransferase [Brucepastera parasyntrophica]|uniref:ACP S-malonyltransferase n=1 Tax=Brucepastera parasyntrophica TaxID=2880008 RepID=UPI00210A8E46|nr:ACP S-malonyltransferase [Brucepastera parasyntrophica]ULQ60795.1 ACP S-malonyltransferase [Brucepastera parasyntrophica]